MIKNDFIDTRNERKDQIEEKKEETNIIEYIWKRERKREYVFKIYVYFRVSA